MAFSLDSKVKDILKNPEAAAVLDKYSPDASPIWRLFLFLNSNLETFFCVK